MTEPLQSRQGRVDQWTLARVVGRDGHPRSEWQIGLPDELPEHSSIEAVCVVAAQEADNLRALLAEWLSASDALKAVDTSNGQAIRAALDRVDVAKRAAREVDAARTTRLAKILRLTYHEDMPDHLADAIRGLVPHV